MNKKIYIFCLVVNIFMLSILAFIIIGSIFNLKEFVDLIVYDNALKAFRTGNHVMDEQFIHVGKERQKAYTFHAIDFL